MNATKQELKKEAMKHIQEQTDLYYDVLADTNSNGENKSLLSEIMRRLVYTTNKYKHLEQD
jgi:hypothetical protein